MICSKVVVAWSMDIVLFFDSIVRVLAKISTTNDFDDILPQNQSESETNEFLVHFHIHLIVFTL